MTLRLRFALLLTNLILAPLPAQAGTAPWYKWQGATRVVCLQYANPKSALKLMDGPYRDSACQHRGRPS